MSDRCLVPSAAGVERVADARKRILQDKLYDYTIPHGLWEGAAETLPAASFGPLERSGHQLFLEEPDRFAAVVTA